MSLHLTNRELDVMAVLWETGSATVAEVQETLTEELAYTTVLTVLRGLEAKGYVRHELEGKAFRYFPTVEPATAGEKVLGRILDKIYQGSRELLVARLLSDEAVSEDELRRIRRMLDERLGEVER
ncbi:MAG: BlaI/MecI/CopY family transcriptional regulator [Gemmatimonadota bacterium]|nr:MAG: BlaI/MecI/CopY family transcriptional regulator [Gemmatimonadota bacterium]